MALRDWPGWQIALLWAVGLALVGLLLRPLAAFYRGRAASGTGGLVAVSLPLSVALVALAILAALGTVTIVWLRGRGAGEA